MRSVISIYTRVPEVFSSLWAFVVEFVGQFRHKVFEVSELQRTPNFFIRVGIKRIEVHPEGAWEQHWVLGEKMEKVSYHQTAIVHGSFYTGSRLQLIKTVYVIKARAQFLLLLLYLRNDSNAWSEVMESNVSDVDSINVDLSLCCFQDPEDSQGKWGLPSSCSTHNSNLKKRRFLSLYMQLRCNFGV